MSRFEAAIRLRPDYADAHNNLGNALALAPGRLTDAITEFKAALRLDPSHPKAHINLGDALAQIPGRMPEKAIMPNIKRLCESVRIPSCSNWLTACSRGASNIPRTKWFRAISLAGRPAVGASMGGVERRAILRVGLGLGIVGLADRDQAQETPASMRPKKATF